MGAQFAKELASGQLSMEESLSIHLRSNHFPPVPSSMIPACVNAIFACQDGDPNELIVLPTGVSWRGSNEAPAYAVVEAHHLDAWIEGEEL
jgi:hypothetical protein